MSGPIHAMGLGEESRFSLEKAKMLIAFFSELLILCDHWFLDHPYHVIALFLSMLLVWFHGEQPPPACSSPPASLRHFIKAQPNAWIE